MDYQVLRLLPDSEFEVMDTLWKLEAQERDEKPSAADLMAASPTLGKLKLTTVLTLLTRLIAKGYISQEKTGRSKRYTALIKEDAYKREAANRFVATVYRNNTAGMISALYNGGNLSAEDIDELRKLVASFDEENSKK